MKITGGFVFKPLSSQYKVVQFGIYVRFQKIKMDPKILKKNNNHYKTNSDLYRYLFSTNGDIIICDIFHVCRML